MAELAARESIASLAEAWLARSDGWRASPLPAALRILYESRKCRAAFRGDITHCAAGLGLLAVFYLPLHASMTSRQLAFDSLYVGLLAPAQFIALIAVLRRPDPFWRDVALGTPSLLAMASGTYLFIVGGGTGSVLFVAISVMLMLFAIISVHMRFTMAVGWVLAWQIFFAAGIATAGDLAPAFQIDVILVGLTCGLYMLLANWRMHVEQQRSFVFSLREQMQQDALTAENRTLDALARRDALTGLANRRAYDSWLHTVWVQAGAGGAGTVGLVMLDVDHFKLYNDFYGHPAGDSCLSAIGACLREQLRGTSDQVARIGGEEFAVLLPGVGLNQCADIAERLRAAIVAMELPHLGHGSGKLVTISCGCASLKVAEAAPRDLCVAADAALYEAKQSGRNRVCLGDVVSHTRTAADA